MLAKASLHNHTEEDPKDGKFISYGIHELIDKAYGSGFDVLAITPHKKYVVTEKHIEYAAGKNILLIPGIEIEITEYAFFHHHIILLNVAPAIKEEAEGISGYEQLKTFKNKNPGVFILAAHPDFGRFESMGHNNLEKNIGLFDGVELCWFYSDGFNLNKRSLAIAKKFHKPVIATADAHTLDFFATDYCDIECDRIEITDVINSLKNGRVTNHSRPKIFFKIFLIFIIIEIKSKFKYFL
jgi:predicted metal-dependent phosphoesterase TrpH